MTDTGNAKLQDLGGGDLVLYLPMGSTLVFDERVVYVASLLHDPGRFVPVLQDVDGRFDMPGRKEGKRIIERFMFHSRVKECSPVDLRVFLWVCYQMGWVILPKRTTKAAG